VAQAESQQLAERWHRLERAGEGATAIVWRARDASSGRVVALKTARGTGAAEAALLREAQTLALVDRRWGPALVDAGPGFLATEWLEGVPLDPRAVRDEASGTRGAGESLAALVAHGVARALEELHEARVRHGDVKPANVLLAPVAPAQGGLDTPAHRGATLVDLGLAGSMVDTPLGGTPRYAAPEVRERGEGGPGADLWSLGLVLAEILDPRVADADDPLSVMARWDRAAQGEPARWAGALVAGAPGGRPSAAWIAGRAARWLGLRPDPREQATARAARVRRAYMTERARDVAAGAPVAPSIAGPARKWLEEACAWAGKLPAARHAPVPAVEPLGAVRRGRYLVSLVGPSAAAWPLGADGRAEGELVARCLDLAAASDPASWTLEDVLGRSEPRAPWVTGDAADRVARLVRELARPAPSPEALALAEDEVAARHAPPTLALELARALARAGETGRAWLALARSSGAEVDALRAEIARRRGDGAEALACAARAEATGDGPARWSGQATRARLAWDAGDLDGAEKCLDGARGPAAAEVRALVAWRRGAAEPGLRAVEQALAEPLDGDAYARLESVRGALEHARGAIPQALRSLGRAVEQAARAGAIVDEAAYLTSDAAAASDAGDLARALGSATRAALLWERLGRPERAARAWLARAGALATVGAVHDADEAAGEAAARALESGDVQAAAYARWAEVEARPPGDPRAEALAIDAARRLEGGSPDDVVRAAARLLVWASGAIDDRAVAERDEQAARCSAPVRWEWWGARAQAILSGRRAVPAADAAAVLGALAGLVDVPAPLFSRGPALDAAVRLATERADGEMARRFEVARGDAARALREGTPPEYRASLAAVSWARASAVGAAEVAFAPAQIAELESIVRALSRRDGLRPLLEQVLDTLVLWTGVERGLLLLPAPDGRLVPRAARNLGRHDLQAEQMALSQTIARRAIESGDAVVATDAFSTLGDVHASVHALRLRSVLAVPLCARGETLGVVYLDDRVRKGAFGPAELAWVRVVASQAAMAIADARDAVLLRRAARRAERARARLEAVLEQREAELDVTRTQLEYARDTRETRFEYDEIAGRSEPMRELLHMVDRVTASEVPVLLVGESGTGKELIARAVHRNGPRGRHPFVTENCASVPESLLESTLFGHVRGAFTGASSTRAGLFDVAHGGTLFLDEIGEMSLAMQAKLLRVLQDGEVRAVGSEKSRKVDVRVLGATHRDLEAMVAEGRFREDLLYRLNVITLRVPPLRERAQDIPLLAHHFLEKHGGGRGVKVTRAAMGKLAAYPWPGNVRQLENELRRALVLADSVIDVAELSADVVRGGPPGAGKGGADLKSRVDALEVELVTEALAKTRGNQTRAAQALGLSRFGLQKMMKRLAIKGPE
jgi:transcriptional regulator with GAF, ATPase, and Fis domain